MTKTAAPQNSPFASHRHEARTFGWTAISDEHHEFRHGDLTAWTVLMELYARVRRKPAIVEASRGTVGLGVGECVFGYREIADRLGLTLSKVRFATRRLEEKYGFITLNATPSGTVATVPFVKEFANTMGARTHHDKHAARKRHLTETGKTKTAVASSKLASPSKEQRESPADDVVRLHKFQEKLRRETLGDRYTPIPLHAVSGVITNRLAEYTKKQCKRVLQADAEEFENTDNARFFGKGSWTEKNFAIKLAYSADVAAQRDARRPPRVPWKRQREGHQRQLDGLVKFTGMSEKTVLRKSYAEFPKRFHKEKKSWSKVRQFWDGKTKDWADRDIDTADDSSLESYED